MVEIREIKPADHAAWIQTFDLVVRGGYTVKPHVQRFVDDLEVYLGYPIDVGTYAGHSPPEGPTQAVDIFNADNSSGYAQQDKIAAWARKNQKKYGIRYVIRRHEIWNIERDAEGWRDQGVQGNRTADHYDHTHITFYASAEPMPDVPAPIQGDVDSMKVRYIWGPDALNQVDWVFDAPGRIHATGMTAQVLEACDKNGVPELGRVDNQTHQWFENIASQWQ